MSERVEPRTPMRPVITGSLVVCLSVAMAPWLSGGQEPLARVISGGALLAAAALAWLQPVARRMARGLMLASFGSFVMFAGLSYLWSANRYATVVWVATWIMAGLAFHVSYVLAGEQEGAIWLINAYLASAAIFVAFALIVFFTGTYSRLIGAFYWPNPAAAYLMPAVLISLDRVRTRPRAMLYRAAFVVFLCSFLLTDSRAASAILLIVVIVYLLVERENRRFWINLWFMTMLGIVLSIGAGWLGNITGHHSGRIVPGSRIAQVVEGQAGSVKQRLQFAESALAIWLDHPLGGTGAGTFASVHPRYQKTVVSASADAHDLYIQTLAELGLVGGVLLICVVVTLLTGTLRGLVRRPELLAVGLSGAALLMHFGADIDAQYPALLLLAAVLFGIVWQGMRTDRARLTLLGPTVAMVVMIPIGSLYIASSRAERGQAAQTAGDWGAAAQEYDAAHHLPTYDPAYLNAEGINIYAIASLKRPDSSSAAAMALALARQAERQDPYDGQNYQLQGRIYTLERRNDLAEAAFRQALKLDPNDEPSYALDLATVQYNSGDYTGAEHTADVMLAKYPMSVINDRLADTTIRPTVANLYALAGDSYLKQGNLDRARSAAKAALQIQPDSLSARALMHQVAKRSGQGGL